SPARRFVGRLSYSTASIDRLPTLTDSRPPEIPRADLIACGLVSPAPFPRYWRDSHRAIRARSASCADRRCVRPDSAPHALPHTVWRGGYEAMPPLPLR